MLVCVWEIQALQMSSFLTAAQLQWPHCIAESLLQHQNFQNAVLLSTTGCHKLAPSCPVTKAPRLWGLLSCLFSQTISVLTASDWLYIQINFWGESEYCFNTGSLKSYIWSRIHQPIYSYFNTPTFYISSFGRWFIQSSLQGTKQAIKLIR